MADQVNFMNVDQAIIDLWRDLRASYLSEHNLNQDDIVRASIPFLSQQPTRFDFIDLFAGIGGFNLALSANGGNCLFSCEWDKQAKNTYFNNYGKMPFGDINDFVSDSINDEKINALIPDHHVLAAGFPCQPFSHAGVSARTSLGIKHGFECEAQGTLFYSIARIAAIKQPQVLLLENVKHIVRHDNGKTFAVIKKTLENLSGWSPNAKDYVFEHRIINSQSLVSQRRERCFMVCVRQDVANLNGKFEFPAIDGEAKPLRQALEVLSPDQIEEYTISDKLWQGHLRRTKNNLARNTGFTAFAANLDKPSNTIVARYGKDGKECLVPQGDGMNPRKLTIRECANLFGYPDGFITPTAKTPAYKQFGNSVVVPVVSAISSKIVEYLRI